MTRDRFATRAAILESAAELIAAHGVNALGVNVLAQAAGCDKVLIYRYFGGLDGVLATLGVERMLWPTVEVGSDGDASLADLMQTAVLEEWAALAGGALMLEAEAAEVGRGNALGRAVGVQRGERHGEIIAALRASHRVPPYVDLEAVLEILSAALTLLALRSASGASTGRAQGREHTHVGDRSASRLDPSTPEGWRRIEKTIGMMARALLES